MSWKPGSVIAAERSLGVERPNGVGLVGRFGFARYRDQRGRVVGEETPHPAIKVVPRTGLPFRP